MKNKKLILSVLAALALTLMFSSMAECTTQTVKVAVFFEKANISSSEKAKILDALGVVESRFEAQIGVAKPVFDEKGTWTSIKGTEDPDAIFHDALQKVKIPVGYSFVIFFVDQPMTEYGWFNSRDVWAAGNRAAHACMVRYDGDDDKLRALIQWALSYTFGLDECDESWCIMNPDYMPHPIYWWIIKVGEDWAEAWGPNCRQRLINNYEPGATYTYKNLYGYVGGDTYYWVSRLSLTYYHWRLVDVDYDMVVGYTYSPFMWDSHQVIVAPVVR